MQHGKDYITEHKPDWEFPFREARLTPETPGSEDFPVQARTGQFREEAKHWFINDKKNPYEEAKPFTWIQGNHLGGRSLMWGRQVYRWSDLDFEANLKDGHGVDWPIRYADIAPWYSHVERFIGVSGEKLGLSYLPDGEFQPPMELNAAEKFVKRGVERSFPGRHVTIGRVAILTRDLPGRAACHYCGPCARGCSTGSYFSSHSSTLPAAQKTGRLTIQTNSVAHSLIYDESARRVTGVRVVDAESKQVREVFGKVVFLCASTINSTRILMNTKTANHPNGLDESGSLGHNLMDHHFLAGANGGVPGLLDRYYQGNRPNGIYLARFRNLGDDGTKRTDFVRGYGYQGGAGRAGWGRGGAEPGIGVALKRKMRQAGDWGFGMTAFAECLPYHENKIELTDKNDEYGMPILRVDAKWRENELAMRKDMQASAGEMLEAAGCRNVNTYDAHREGELGAEIGLGIHEMGTARMGRDPKTSVLNSWNQAHVAPNLFVTDGACMTSASCVNPSITYMALTARAAGHAIEELKKRNL